jgi:hypothetical protein
MRTRRALIGVAAVVLGGLVTATVGVTTAAGGDRSGPRTIKSVLSGYEEDPMALSTAGSGFFRARIDSRAGTIDYSLSYADLEGSVTQAHIHLGGRAQSGGISVFLCSNLGNGPAGTQPCPAAPATVTGTIRAADVIGPVAQGITAGQFDELLDAIRADTTYVNVHSSLYPGGEVRSQLDHRGLGGFLRHH